MMCAYKEINTGKKRKR